MPTPCVICGGGLVMPRFVVLAMVLAVVAGCTGQSAPTDRPSPTPAASAVALATLSPSPSEAEPTAAATEPPTNPSVPAGCPTTSPLRVADFLAADPACFGASEVSVIGW